MRYEFRDDRIYLTRTPDEKAPLLNRLARIEGQIRGLRQMIDDDRYCADELQQSNAITAAVREVALLIVGQHIEAGIACALESEAREAVTAEVVSVLRKAMKT